MVWNKGGFMRKTFCTIFVLSVFAQSATVSSTTEIELGAKTDDPKEIANQQNDLLPLGEPVRNISGAYYGIGIGLARTHHKLNFLGNNGFHYNSSAYQPELSFIVGFGAPIWERWYAGIELDLFHRFKGKTAHLDNGIHLEHSANSSVNMDVRFGYLFPEFGNMVYLTAGFSRIFAKVRFNVEKDNFNKKCSTSFGSFVPTIGLGVEHKINHLWSVRLDYRFAIPSNEKEQIVKNYAGTWHYKGKANRMNIRLSITRDIANSLY